MKLVGTDQQIRPTNSYWPNNASVVCQRGVCLLIMRLSGRPMLMKLSDLAASNAFDNRKIQLVPICGLLSTWRSLRCIDLAWMGSHYRQSNLMTLGTRSTYQRQRVDRQVLLPPRSEKKCSNRDYFSGRFSDIPGRMDYQLIPANDDCWVRRWFRFVVW